MSHRTILAYCVVAAVGGWGCSSSDPGAFCQKDNGSDCFKKIKTNEICGTGYHDADSCSDGGTGADTGGGGDSGTTCNNSKRYIDCPSGEKCSCGESCNQVCSTCFRCGIYGCKSNADCVSESSGYYTTCRTYQLNPSASVTRCDP